MLNKRGVPLEKLTFSIERTSERHVRIRGWLYRGVDLVGALNPRSLTIPSEVVDQLGGIADLIDLHDDIARRVRLWAASPILPLDWEN
ncbi:MAG: hypothetical protein ACTHQQ_01290 [Solirubrobacteraceae bacterium]